MPRIPRISSRVGVTDPVIGNRRASGRDFYQGSEDNSQAYRTVANVAGDIAGEVERTDRRIEEIQRRNKAKKDLFEAQKVVAEEAPTLTEYFTEAEKEAPVDADAYVEEKKAFLQKRKEGILEGITDPDARRYAELHLTQLYGRYNQRNIEFAAAAHGAKQVADVNRISTKMENSITLDPALLGEHLESMERLINDAPYMSPKSKQTLIQQKREGFHQAALEGLIRNLNVKNPKEIKAFREGLSDSPFAENVDSKAFRGYVTTLKHLETRAKEMLENDLKPSPGTPLGEGREAAEWYAAEAPQGTDIPARLVDGRDSWEKDSEQYKKWDALIREAKARHDFRLKLGKMTKADLLEAKKQIQKDIEASEGVNLDRLKDFRGSIKSVLDDITSEEERVKTDLARVMADEKRETAKAEDSEAKAQALKVRETLQKINERLPYLKEHGTPAKEDKLTMSLLEQLPKDERAIAEDHVSKALRLAEDLRVINSGNVEQMAELFVEAKEFAAQGVDYEYNSRRAGNFQKALTKVRDLYNEEQKAREKARIEAAEARRKELERFQKDLDEDPAGAIIRADEVARQHLMKLSDVQGSEKPDPKEIAESYETLFEYQVAAQKHFRPGQTPQLLDKTMRDAFVERINIPPGEGDTGNEAVNTLAMVIDVIPKRFQAKVLDELGRAGARIPALTVMTFSKNRHLAEEFLRSNVIKAKDLELGMQNGKAIEQSLYTRARNHSKLNDFKDSIAHHEGAAATRLYAEVLEHLVRHSMWLAWTKRGGEEASTSHFDTTVDRFLADWQFRGSLRIPKGIDADLVERGRNRFIQGDLSSKNIIPPPSLWGLKDVDVRAEYVRTIQSQGSMGSTSDTSAAILLDPAKRPVYEMVDGEIRPVTVNLVDLEERGRTESVFSITKKMFLGGAL